jgi:anti-sigma B factor antagonist
VALSFGRKLQEVGVMAIDETALAGPADFTAEVRDETGATVVTLAGEIDFSGAGALREVFVLPEVLTAPAVRVDLTGVEYLGSPGIGVIVSACKRIRGSGGTFSVICGQNEPWRILEACGLLEYLDVEGDSDSQQSHFASHQEQ